MPKKFQNKYRINSARLKNYDYSKNGAYFVTIVTKKHVHFFGKIVDNIMVLNTGGKISQEYWNKIPQYFPFIKLDEMVIMPNHIHGILWIDNDYAMDGKDGDGSGRTKKHGGITEKNNPMFYDNISRIIRWYKGRCTFEINKIDKNFSFAWQARFYDHIIRNEKELTHKIHHK